MNPYERMLERKNKACCLNCNSLHQEPKENKAEGTDHVNYCKKSGKFILEMHIEASREKQGCFERRE